MWRKGSGVWGVGPPGMSPKAVEWLRRSRDGGRPLVMVVVVGTDPE